MTKLNDSIIDTFICPHCGNTMYIDDDFKIMVLEMLLKELKDKKNTTQESKVKVTRKRKKKIEPEERLYDLPEDHIAIYVDGSVDFNKKGKATAGIGGVCYNNIFYCNIYRGKYITNNTMEAMAVYNGIQMAKKILLDDPTKKIIIYSDSKTVIDTSLGKKVARAEWLVDVINKIKEELKIVNVSIIHKKGHTDSDHIGDVISELMRGYNKDKIFETNQNNVKLLEKENELINIVEN